MNNIYIQKAIDYLGIKNLNISFKQGDDELVVKRSGEDVTIIYPELSHLFYGLTLVKQNENKTNYEIELKPNFKHTGLMHDCSRNGAMNVPYIKEMLMLSALMGLNRFMLYTEDVYEIKGEPYFGYFRGRYTKEELKEIVECAEGFGIEVVPCIQTLSHLSQALRWRPYQSFADSVNTLLINNEKSYELIEKMIKTCAENFHTKSIHIGMDEAFDLGLKEFLTKDIAVDKKKLLLEHLHKVVDICHKYGLHPMMWEDMFFKIDSKATPDWYNFEGKLEDDIKSKIPNDLELIYWDYYHDDIKLYDKMFDVSKDTNRNIIFAGAIISWIGFMPHFDRSLKFSSTAFQSALKHNINSTFICSWGDGNNDCSASAIYPMLALQCLYNFYGEVSKEKISELLKVLTDHDLDDWMTLQLPNTLRDELLQFENPSKAFLYQDILLGLFDTRAKEEFVQKYASYAKELDKLSNKSQRFNYVFKTAADLCECLSHKVMIGKNIRKAYKSNDKVALRNYVKELDIVKELTIKFLASYRKQWDKENKPFGYEITDGRIGWLIKRIDTAVSKLNEYLEGKVSNIPELDEEVLPYNDYPDDEPHCFNIWSDIVTTNKI